MQRALLGREIMQRSCRGKRDGASERAQAGPNRRVARHAGAMAVLGTALTLSLGMDIPRARAAAAAETIRLETSQVGIELCRSDGALVLLENRLTNNTQKLRSVPFQLVTTRGE